MKISWYNYLFISEIYNWYYLHSWKSLILTGNSKDLEIVKLNGYFSKRGKLFKNHYLSLLTQQVGGDRQIKKETDQKKFFFNLKIFIIGRAVTCGILVLWLRTELAPPAMEVQSPNYWTTRKFLTNFFLWGLGLSMWEYKET